MGEIRFQVRIPTQPAFLRLALEFLTNVNVLMLRQAPSLRGLYDSGVRYQREPMRSPEQWRTVADLRQTKRGDCEDLATARAAEYRVAGINARPWLVRINPRLWHIVVKLPDGRIEDPSRVLGMKGPG